MWSRVVWIELQQCPTECCYTNRAQVSSHGPFYRISSVSVQVHRRHERTHLKSICRLLQPSSWRVLRPLSQTFPGACSLGVHSITQRVDVLIWKNRFIFILQITCGFIWKKGNSQMTLFFYKITWRKKPAEVIIWNNWTWANWFNIIILLPNHYSVS